MQDFIRQVLAEFAARGWNAVLHGPEAHLVLPWIGGLAGIVTLVCYFVFAAWRDDDDDH